MCLQPRKIVNRTKCLRPTDAVTLSVPCGDCEECRYIRRTEYAFRIFSEMQKNVSRGWNNFFFTLTYNDENLPKVSFCFKGFRYNDVPVFRRSDIIRFFKNIREYVYRVYKITSISWICCPEYGSHTQRPHYHCYLSLPLPPDVVHALLVRFWRNSSVTYSAHDGSVLGYEWNIRRLSSSNDLGFIYPRDFKGGYDSKGYYHKPLQISNDGIQASSHYVAKYCTKDLSFFSLPAIKAFVSYCKYSSLIEIKRLYREHIFSVLCSNHFGESINDYVKSVKDLVNGVSTSFRSGRLTQIPQYNKRKLLNITRTTDMDPDIKILDDGYTSIEITRQRATYKRGKMVKPTYYHKEKQIVKDSKLVRYNIYERGELDTMKKSSTTNIYRPNWKYKVRYDLTHLGREVAPSFFDSSVLSVCDRLRLFLSEHVWTKDFEIFYDSQKRDNMLSHFLRLVTFRYVPNLKDIAVYSVAYRGRVSPLHLQAFIDDPDIFHSKYTFCDYYNDTGAKVSPDGFRSFFPCFRPFARRFFSIAFTSVPTYRFLGSESLRCMTERAKRFYLSSLSVDKYVDEDNVDLRDFSFIDYVHFDSFPCFKGFNLLLDLMRDFYNSCKSVDLTIVQQYQDQISKVKQMLSENDYEL